MKKRKILITILSSFSVLIVGLIIFIVSAYYSGWNVLSWFNSKQAYLIYGVVALILLGLIGGILFLKYFGGNDK